MPAGQTRRTVIQIGALATATAASGCLFGASQRGEPEHGEIVVIIPREAEWMDEQTFRIVAREDESAVVDESFELPVDTVDLTVDPGTYQMSVYLEGERLATSEWEVTECSSQFQISFGAERSDGVHLGTSDC